MTVRDSGGPTALVAGTTGLIGRALTARLAADATYGRVHLIQRREAASSSPHVVVHVVDFADVESLPVPDPVRDAFCCLGTTLRSAGSREAFREVDYGHVLRFARLARAHGCEHFLFVSSIGASAASSNFYLRTKGEAETALTELGFPTLTILRPSVLLGSRDELRPGERVAQWLAPGLCALIPRRLSRYKPISGVHVAAALLHIAQQPLGPGVHVLEHDDLLRHATA